MTKLQKAHNLEKCVVNKINYKKIHYEIIFNMPVVLGCALSNSRNTLRFDRIFSVCSHCELTFNCLYNHSKKVLL